MPEFDQDYDGIPDEEEMAAAPEPEEDEDLVAEALRDIVRITRRRELQALLGEEASPEAGNDAAEMAAPEPKRPKSLAIIIGASKGAKPK